MANMPGCALPNYLCNEIEKPFYRFLKGREAFLERYAHRDETTWDGNDCEALKTQMRDMVVKREDSYPVTGHYENLWFHFGNLEHIKCNLGDLGKIKSRRSNEDIPYVVGDYELRYHPLWLAVTYNVTHPRHRNRVCEPNVVVEVNKFQKYNIFREV